ncbi:excinuclease ABC subunit UvrA [Paenibacillus sp. FSL H8-0259]|uniref:excinuclease ABC subunit UvrA n=1 Tax=Paenibacillus sp. FSL H8-0259 TaxID=1920423 RepID=UPI00096F50B6|nr:excinuclease ABC subunit UvrA [Paenibacillus sp. FSL H8-0259]OMF33000.1 excinuclease ABC subunit A [Paenibacillus sp. FSL H8-0259]
MAGFPVNTGGLLLHQYITVSGARENNLKNISLNIPRNQLVVFTGVSGSGKSSLAFDTLYAEGQMRYVESLSSYARQFLGLMGKPDVDAIDGLSPAIAIEQKTTSSNPRSTVGTVTEIYDYLRLLWSKIGTPHCPSCGRIIQRQSVDQIVEQIAGLPEGTKYEVLAPMVRNKKGAHQHIFEQAKLGGYVRVRVNGVVHHVTDPISLDKNKKHSIEIVIDRLIVKDMDVQRLADSLEHAFALSGDLVIIHQSASGEEVTYSQSYACPHCEVSLPELSPRMFSFNNHEGACPACTGLGSHLKVDPDKIMPDTSRSIQSGGIIANGWSNVKTNSFCKMYYEALGEKYGFDFSTPLQELSSEAMNVLLYGTNGEKLEVHHPGDALRNYVKEAFEGIVNNLERRYRETPSEAMKKELEEYMSVLPCPHCHGDRLSPVVLGVKVGGKSIAEFCHLPVEAAVDFIAGLSLTAANAEIAGTILQEIDARFQFLNNVGLNYLTLSRAAGTLSGGESQRIRLATQLGSGLMGVLYILDEPSIGLHQRDNDRLLLALKKMRDLGNTLIVVEHDEDTIRQADWIVDIGPNAGIHGGEVVAQGTLEDILAESRSITGQYLSRSRQISVPEERRSGNGKQLTITGAAANNLKGITVSIPLGTLTCVTGVSGSGKSSLVNEILYKKLASTLNRAHTIPGEHQSIDGIEHLDKVINIDQKPIGRTPRSNPATYTGVFDNIRTLFSLTNEAKVRAYGPGRFSFNIKGGRCEACAGDGLIKVEMHFLPDVYVQCSICKGRRYSRETLEVHYKGKSIADVLDLTAQEAVQFFGNIPKIRKKLEALCIVGLGYIKLGQSSTTLSGGEAQRVKLAAELLKPATGSTLYVMDEPTTGLHFADVHQLIDVLHSLTDAGNTVLVIEHNLELIKNADYIIDLGPEGGADGGEIVCTGTPEEVAVHEKSYTGKYLNQEMGRR